MQLGIPVAGIALIASADIIMDYVLTATNILALQMELASSALKFGMLDEQALKETGGRL